jgi:mannitol/fructose-specific phosphotransferase system IIA component (Ntr-type)
MTNLVSLAGLLARGGVHADLPARNHLDAVERACALVDLPEAVDRELFGRAVLEREVLLTTAIGRGLALPHPRNNLPFTLETQRVALFYLREPVDFDALDGRPVYALFLMLSADPRSHLGALSGLSHLAQRDDFHAFLSERPGEAELLAWLETAEAGWHQSGLNPEATR